MASSNLKIFGVIIISIGLIASVYYYQEDILQFFNNEEDNPIEENDNEEDDDEKTDDTYLGKTVYGSGVIFTPENFTQGALDALLTESWYVHIYGNVKLEVYIGISYLTNGDHFNYISDKNYHILNSGGSTSDILYSGAALDDIFTKTKCLRSNSTLFYFNAEDNYRSFNCTINAVMNNPGEFLLANEEGGVELTPNPGNGPIRGTAPLTPLQSDPDIIQIFDDEGYGFVFNSNYFTKYLNRVYIF